MSKCWYCNNELTTGDNPKHFGICNKCYDEMFKSGDTIIRSLTNKIAELQKQLKETKADLFLSRNEIDTLKNNLSISQEHKKIIEEQYLEKCKELKSQPAEIMEKIRKWGEKHYNWVGDGTGYDGQDYHECIGFNRAIDQLNEFLDTILKEYQKQKEKI